jgi:ATP-dependent DNA helicase DinG
MARSDAGYGLETELGRTRSRADRGGRPAGDRGARERCCARWSRWGQRLEAVLDDAPDWLDGQARARIEGAIAGLGWRGRDWSAPGCDARANRRTADPDFVDWLAVDRIEGREFDIGLHRHWLDPSRPSPRPCSSRRTACSSPRPRCAAAATGRSPRRAPARRISTSGPAFRGAEPVRLCRPGRSADRHRRQARRPGALAKAYHRLIAAAGGGTLGPVHRDPRLRAVHARIADRLARDGLPLYAQHVDPIDTGTLVDIFRDDPRASLLGTDALRDGVDVPGDSLRLVVMEGVPWPRPTVLHAAARRPAAAAPMTTASSARGSAGVRPADPPRRRSRPFRDCSARRRRRGCSTPSPPGSRSLRVTLDEAVARVAAASGARHGTAIPSPSGVLPGLTES